MLLKKANAFRVEDFQINNLFLESLTQANMVAENYLNEWLIRKQKKKKEKKAKKGKPNIQTNEQIGGQMNVSQSLVDSQL